MKNSFLIPNVNKVYGWIIFISFSLLGLSTMYLALPELSSSLDFANLTNEFALTGVTAGLLMIAFSREKNEDEYISFIRLRSWQWSILVSYFILIILNFIFYGPIFINVMVHNLFTLPIIFIARFNYSLYKLRKERVFDEK